MLGPPQISLPLGKDLHCRPRSALRARSFEPTVRILYTQARGKVSGAVSKILPPIKLSESEPCFDRPPGVKSEARARSGQECFPPAVGTLFYPVGQARAAHVRSLSGT